MGILKTEPVAVLGVLTALVAALIAFGVIDATQGGALAGVIAAVGAILVRSKVTPTVTIPPQQVVKVMVNPGSITDPPPPAAV